MTAPPPWVAYTPPADPDVRIGPTVYADDPPGVVAFLTDPPWHQAADGGCYVPNDAEHDDDCESGWYEDMCGACREAADAARCRHCSGTGIWSDEDKQMACPYCGATGEGDAD